METMKKLIEGLKSYEKFTAVSQATGKTVRCMRESNGSVFVYAPGKKHYGWRYSSIDSFLSNYGQVKVTDEGGAWHRRVNNVVKALKSSGLWPEILEVFVNLSTMDYADREDIKNIYWDHQYVNGRFVCPRQAELDAYKIKYPFLFDKDGNVNTRYIYEMSDARTKSMYFGKYQNANAKAHIANALANKIGCSIRERTSYDVSFEYDPAGNKAWYSEEYKGCGNGHYYLALGPSMALFYEND